MKMKNAKSVTLWIVLIFSIFFVCRTGRAPRALTVQLKDDLGNSVNQMQLYDGSYALLVGVSDYTSGWPDLESVPGELETVKALLESKGFVVEKQINPDSTRLREIFESYINRYGYQPQNRLLFAEGFDTENRWFELEAGDDSTVDFNLTQKSI